MGLFDNARKWLNKELNKNVSDIAQEYVEQYNNNMKLAEPNEDAEKQIAAQIGFEYQATGGQNLWEEMTGKFKLFPEDNVSSELSDLNIGARENRLTS